MAHEGRRHHRPAGGLRCRSTVVALIRVADLLRTEAFSGLPVAVCAFKNDEISPFRSFMEWWPGFREQGDRQLMQEFDFSRYPVFWHNTYSPLTAELSVWLRENAIREVLVTGVETSASVVMFSMQLFDIGVRPVVCFELVGDTYGDQGQKAGVSVLRKVLSEANIMAYSRLSSWAQSTDI
ncbi:isochorismatase family protein [Thermogymnomonas acidicola]|nr:isochorismatase family protein [Thermogymnomonas acidicola]